MEQEVIAAPIDNGVAGSARAGGRKGPWRRSSVSAAWKAYRPAGWTMWSWQRGDLLADHVEILGRPLQDQPLLTG